MKSTNLMVAAAMAVGLAACSKKPANDYGDYNPYSGSSSSRKDWNVTQDILTDVPEVKFWARVENAEKFNELVEGEAKKVLYLGKIYPVDYGNHGSDLIAVGDAWCSMVRGRQVNDRNKVYADGEIMKPIGAATMFSMSWLVLFENSSLNCFLRGGGALTQEKVEAAFQGILSFEHEPEGWFDRNSLVQDVPELNFTMRIENADLFNELAAKGDSVAAAHGDIRSVPPGEAARAAGIDDAWCRVRSARSDFGNGEVLEILSAQDPYQGEVHKDSWAMNFKDGSIECGLNGHYELTLKNMSRALRGIVSFQLKN